MSVSTPRSGSSGSSPAAVTGYQAYSVNGVHQYDIPYQVYGPAARRFFDGYDVVGFHKLRRSGAILPLSPWHQVEKSWIDPQVSFDLSTVSGTISRWSSSVSGVPSWPTDPSNFQTHRGELSVDAMARLYAGGWDALTFFAEFKKLIEMFKGMWGQLLDLVKSHDYANLVDAWLTVRYGFRPLYYDIVSFTEMLRNLSTDRLVNKARAGRSDSQSGTYTAYFGAMEYDVNWETKINERFSVFSQIDPPRVLIDPVLTAWELVRFSFIVDWFIDIGSWLAAMRGASVHADVAGSYGTVVEFKATLSNARISNPAIYTGYVFISGTVEEKITIRDPSPVELPLLPNLQFNMNWFKVADLIAIFKR